MHSNTELTVVNAPVIDVPDISRIEALVRARISLLQSINTVAARRVVEELNERLVKIQAIHGLVGSIVKALDDTAYAEELALCRPSSRVWQEEKSA